MIIERYRAPSYRVDLVAARYVRNIGGDRFRVYECVAKRTAQNRDKRLSRVGAGPTIREYDCTAGSLPDRIITRAKCASGVVRWET